jgi:hypothetical protein
MVGEFPDRIGDHPFGAGRETIVGGFGVGPSLSLGPNQLEIVPIHLFPRFLDREIRIELFDRLGFDSGSLRTYQGNCEEQRERFAFLKERHFLIPFLFQSDSLNATKKILDTIVKERYAQRHGIWVILLD